MSKYEDVKSIKDARDHVTLQIGRALYALDNNRAVLKSDSDLPSVGSKFVLIEEGTTSKNGLNTFDTNVWYDDIGEVYNEDTIIQQTQSFRITAASDDPETFLKIFVAKRQSEDFWWSYFHSQDIGVQSISDITKTSVVVDGGDMEIRFTCTLVVNYLSKFSAVINTIEKITFTDYIDRNTSHPISDEGELDAGAYIEDVNITISTANSIYKLVNEDLPEGGSTTWWTEY